MKYQKEYIDLLIKESAFSPGIKPILEKYFLNSISFVDLTNIISISEIGVTKFSTFKKDKDIDSLFI